MPRAGESCMVDGLEDGWIRGWMDVVSALRKERKMKYCGSSIEGVSNY